MEENKVLKGTLEFLSKRYGIHKINPPGVMFNGYVYVDDFYIYFWDNKIKRYRKFNRKKVWGIDDVNSLEESVFDGDLYNPIVLVPIYECIQMAIDEGRKDDEEFFKGAYENGEYQWLTLIGGNRGEALQIIRERNDDIHNKVFGQKMVNLTITGPMSRHEIHRKFQKDMCGCPPNRQEGRNSIWNGHNCESEWVFYTSKNYSDLILSNNGLKRNDNRMLDDEFVATLCLFTRHRCFGSSGIEGVSSTDDAIDAIYKENSTSSERKKTIEMLDYLKQVWEHMPDERQEKRYWQCLITMGGVIQDDKLTWVNSRKSPKTFQEEWNSYYFDLIQDQDTTYKPANDIITFSTMVGGFLRDTHIKEIRIVLNKFIDKMIKMGVLKVDRSEDLATTKQRNQVIKERKEGKFVWIRQNGLVEGVMFDENLPEFVKIPFDDIKDKVSYPTDHIQPKDVDGEHEVENMEITTQAYNSWKRKRIPNYEKLTLNEIIKKS